MDFKTTSRIDFKPFGIYPSQKQKESISKFTGPLPSGSHYSKEYPNWGASEILIEKTPQYPVYQLPFKGKTLY